MKIIAIVILIVITFSYCNSKGKATSQDNVTSLSKDTLNYTQIMEKTQGVNMCIQQTQISIRSDYMIVATITNNSSKQITTDLYYTIEYFDSKDWVKCEYSMSVITNDVALYIKPLSSIDIDIYLYPELHEYKIGKYRIKKPITINEKEEYLYTMFEIK